MNFRSFGETGIVAGEIGVGCGSLGAQGKTELENTLLHALDLGVNLFDTADIYTKGQSEIMLGNALASIPRHKYVLATKFGNAKRFYGGYKKNFSVQHMKRMFEQSLKRLRTDYIDIYQLHNPPDGILERDELWLELDRMVAAGQIRCFGLSIESADFARRFLSRTQGQVLQMIFNPFHQEPRKILHNIKERGAGMLVKVPLAGGTLTSRCSNDWPPLNDPRRQRWGPQNFAERLKLIEYLKPILENHSRTFAQGALAWLLTISPNLIPIPGLASFEYLKETASAAGMRLTPEEMRAIDAIRGGDLCNLRFGW